MKGIIFTSLLFLMPFTVLIAQDENKVFEKGEQNANADQKTWNEHISKKTQLPDSVIKDIPAGACKVNVQFCCTCFSNPPRFYFVLIQTQLF
jgi:hypothetical protein